MCRPGRTACLIPARREKAPGPGKRAEMGMFMERLDKILASQGVGSRKEAGLLIRRGLVEVNGAAVSRPEEKADPERDAITVAGKPLRFQRHLYLMMNKPAGVVSASRDSREKTVVDLVPEDFFRRDLFPAGRLDRDTTGLLILTDDGDFAHRMLSPKKHVYKRYEASLDGPVGTSEIEKFEAGVVLEDGAICLPAKLTVVSGGSSFKTLVEIREGKYHQVKKMFLAVGRRVLSLKRVRIGGLELDKTLKEGECRELTERELELVFQAQNKCVIGMKNVNGQI